MRSEAAVRLALSSLMLLGVLLGAGAVPAAWAAGYATSELKAVETENESKVRDLRRQEITQLRITLGRRNPANRRADLYFRLAEIYLEAYRTEYLLEGRVHEKRLEAGSKEKGIDHSHSRPHLLEGIKASQEILRLGIPYPRLDQVYFFLGFNYGELGNQKESLRYFGELARRFPDSPFTAEAYQQMGDAAFASGQFRAAQGHFEAAAAQASRRGPSESTATLPRILHRLAWSYYRTRQFDRAVDTMKRAITAAQKSDEKLLSLREEALRDMAIFLTETGKAEEAVAYFRSVVGDKSFYPKLLEKLGKQYERGVEPAKATQVYESLLKTDPESEAAFRVFVKLVDLELRRARYREALDRLRKVRLPKGGDPDTQVAAQNLRAMVRRTATEQHEKHRKGTAGALELAEAFYVTYLNTFLAKDDPRQETPEIRMYLAEVKRDLGRSREASELYHKVVDSGDRRYAKEAGALWMSSLAEAMRKDKSNAKAHEPSELEREFISAADALQEALGETPEGREAALKAAEILAGYKEAHKDAIKRARKIIDRWPRSIQAVTAARLWVQLLSDRLPSSSSDAAQVSSGALDDLRDAMKELRENAALLAADQELGKGKLKAQLGDQEFRLKIVSIAVHEKDKDHGAAAQGYEAFAKDATQRELAEKAYASALANYLKASDEEGRERVAAAWLQRYPRSPKAIESLRLVATQELIQGHFEKAARLFEKLGGEGGDADSLETAARIHEGIGDQARAIAAWRRYLATYKTAHVPAIRLQLARALDLSQQDSEAAKAYRDCMSVPELAAECGARLADLHLRARNAAEAKALFKKVGASAGAAARSPWVAYSRYMLASFQEQEARFAPLELPEAQLKKAMNQRLAFLEQLSRAYGSAVEAGGPWAIAALDRLAGWVMGFAEEVERIAAPPGAAPAAVAQFRKTLAGVSGPLRKKAVQTWQEAYTKCIAAEAMSPALPEIADRLADSGIAGVGRAQGVHGLYRLAGVPADGGPEGSSAALEKTRAKLVKNPQDSVAWLDYGNLLWGQGKPLLSSLAYDRAEALNRRSPAAINNRAVVELSLAKGTSEDWLVAATASERFRGASKLDEFFLPAKFNRASLLNYYRLFPKAKPLWEQVLAKGAGADAQDGMAIALQGTGDLRRAEAAFQRASELGSPDSRFAAVYHEAARLAATSPAQCLSRIEDGDSATLTGFEKNAFERLKRACTSWNMQGKTTTQP